MGVLISKEIASSSARQMHQKQGRHTISKLADLVTEVAEKSANLIDASAENSAQQATNSSNVQKTNTIDRALLDALLSSKKSEFATPINFSTSINTSKQLLVVRPSTFSPRIFRGADIFERGKEDAILDEYF